MECRGFVLAAPASSSGKTTVALGILRWMAMAGLPVRAAKCGPDYIDPTFHAVASGQPSVNLDAWAMPETELRKLAACPGGGPQQPGLLLVEGAMGVLDGGGPAQAGSAADLAGKLGLPIVLVIDVSRQGASAVLPVLGLRAAFRGIEIKGVILNRLGSERHGKVVRAAMDHHGIRVFGGLHRNEALALPSRHLGLVPAGEHREVTAFLDQAAQAVGAGVDMEALLSSAETLRHSAAAGSGPALPPPGNVSRSPATVLSPSSMSTFSRVGAGEVPNCRSFRRWMTSRRMTPPMRSSSPADTRNSMPAGWPAPDASGGACTSRCPAAQPSTVNAAATWCSDAGLLTGTGCITECWACCRIPLRSHARGSTLATACSGPLTGHLSGGFLPATNSTTARLKAKRPAGHSLRPRMPTATGSAGSAASMAVSADPTFT